MGHRAVYAVERGGGRYDCFGSQWGGLTVFEDHHHATETDSSHGVGGGEAPVDSVRIVDGASALEVLDHLDPRVHEALFVHGREGSSAHLVRWLGVPTAAREASESAPGAVLVPVADAAVARRLDAAIRTAKAVLGDVVDAGLLQRPAAERYLAAFVARHPDVPRETLWIPSEVA